jgi:hypothetical protein
MPTPKASISLFNTPATWNGRMILTDTAYVPYSFCAFLDGDEDGFIEFGHSEEQAIERLIEKLEDAGRPRCSDCDSTNVAIEDYAGVPERETGYVDASQVIRCLDCGCHERFEAQQAIPPVVRRKPVASAMARVPEVA